MVFYLIGLGLGDIQDITVKGLEIVRRCERVYLESYTSILCYGLGYDISQLEKFYGRPILEADRDLVEQDIEKLLEDARISDIALLVVGDPFSATTHTDILLRAKKIRVPVEIVHNASIINAVGCCGLQLYTFGEIVSIPLWTNNWKPTSFYDKIIKNRSRGLHTLCLLDIKTKERSVENLIKGKDVFEPPRFMTCSEAAGQLLELRSQLDENENDGNADFHLDSGSMVVGLARIGWKDQKIAFCSLKNMISKDLGLPLHSLIIPSKILHPMELDVLEAIKNNS